MLRTVASNSSCFLFYMGPIFPVITETILCNVYERPNRISTAYHFSDDSICFSDLPYSQ